MIANDRRVSVISTLRFTTCLFAATIIAVSVTACNRDATARSEQASLGAKVEEVSDSSLLHVSHPERFPVIKVSSRAIADRLSGTCVVSPDVNRTVPVNALGGGRVVDLRASLGDHVRKGQTLVTISSPDLASALSDHLKAVADEALSHKQLDRSRLLFEHGSIAEKDVEASEDADQKAKIDLRTTETRIRMLGGDASRSTPLIELKSPIDGTIIEQNVTASAGVKSPDNAPNLFTIADLSRIWVLCDVHENDLAHARLGEIARIRLSAYPDRSFTGRISNISQVLDPDTRTAKLRVELANQGGLFRPGMYGEADLESSILQNRWILPTTAIVQLHDANWVFVKEGATAFRRVQIRSGREVGPGLQEVLEGLSRGQDVVRNALPFVQAADQ